MRWPRLLLSGLASLMVAGCGLARMQAMQAEQARIAAQTAEAERIFASENAACEQKHPNAYDKPAMPLIRCINDARVRFFQKGAQVGQFAHMDLLHALNAQRALAAERYDAGKLTRAEFEAELTTAHTHFASLQSQRDNQAAMVGAAQNQAAAQASAAAAAQSQAAMARQKMISDAFKGPPTVTCTTYGNTTNCR